MVKKIAVISNITVKPFLDANIKKMFKQSNIFIETIYIPFEDYHSQEYCRQLQSVEMIVLWVNLECMAFDMHKTYEFNENRDLIQSVHQQIVHYVLLHSKANIFVVLLEDYYSALPIVTGCHGHMSADEYNNVLIEDLLDKVTFLDLKRLIAMVGINFAYSYKNKIRWNYPYSKNLTELIAEEIRKNYFVEHGITKKCLVLDCDNVLWGGILSEDGKENIKLGNSGLGKEYQEFQKFVLELYHRGVILALCSKNDLDDVLALFREHDGMILKEEHIANYQVNWRNKPENIKHIAKALNIGMDSMVFVDDSIVEIEAVKAILPEVTTILYEREHIYSKFSCFNLKSVVDMDSVSRRTTTYRTNELREQLKTIFENYDDYLNALETNVDIHLSQSVEYSRIAELTQRTNKCTNGERYTVAQLKERSENENTILYSVFLSDRYSDFGLVGVFEIESNVLTLFSLSCRALGRKIESKMLKFLKEHHQISSIKFHHTGKNQSLKLLLTEEFNNRIIIVN